MVSVIQTSLSDQLQYNSLILVVNIWSVLTKPSFMGQYYIWCDFCTISLAKNNEVWITLTIYWLPTNIRLFYYNWPMNEGFFSSTKMHWSWAVQIFGLWNCLILFCLFVNSLLKVTIKNEESLIYWYIYRNAFLI
jgi:hypothetical protein